MVFLRPGTWAPAAFHWEAPLMPASGLYEELTNAVRSRYYEPGPGRTYRIGFGVASIR